MSLPAGTLIGPYEIVAPLGAGGMGEVYLARDARLDRTVAIKILPDAFANDPERLARFEREAKTLASLNHPHIAQIYGVEQLDTTRALVMELVEGEDLSDRIARGPLPVPEALAIARQIADALEAAHDRGVIHRDLKPANIKVTDDGRVKVLDFGLAKAMDPAGTSSASLMNSPTITSPPTELGMIIGTAAYMSPEQAKGKAVDRRADVWSFGVVLFEMLTGRRLFEGDDVTEVLASVLKDSPSHDALPAATPHPVRRLLRRCLEKDRAKRLDSMAAARLEIDDAMGAREDAPAVSSPGGLAFGRAAAAIVLTAAAASLIGGAAVWRAMAPPPAPVLRFSLTPPAGMALRLETNHHDLAIARDGSRIVYWSHDSAGANRIFVRPAGGFDTHVLDAGPDARGMFLSPDGAWIGFQWGGPSAEGAQLMKMPSTGGTPVLITRLDGNLRNASWGADGTILFATHRQATGLFRVSAAGGDAEAITTPDVAAGEIDHVWPSLLPGGTHALFSIRRQGSADVALLDLQSRAWRVLVKGGTMPSYVPTGHLLYADDGMLYAAPFNLGRLELAGEAQRMVEGVVTKDSGAADYAVSDNGTLVYMPGGVAAPKQSLVWFDRSGKYERTAAEPRQYRNLSLSPDGRKAAVTIEEESATGLWVLDLDRLTLTRLTPPGVTVTNIVWSPDGRSIAFTGIPTTGREPGGIHRVLASGTAPPELLVPNTPAFRKNVTDWTSDGSRILFVDVVDGSAAIAEVNVSDKRVRVVLNSSANETAGKLSPDGRWLAYTANDSGRAEVYVRPYPDVTADRITVTAIGGRAPHWRRDGRELIVRDPSGDLHGVPVSYAGGTIAFGAPARILDTAGIGRNTIGAIEPLAARFLYAVPTETDAVASEYRVVLNWFEELKARFRK